uniref:Myb/SANT-like domain-containing protein n=1 Tax=Setaria digitata TaxID=48799 RepID=A0A915PII5_9BILA
MAVRCMYTLRDERLMWEHVFERLQAGDEAAYQPKGLKLWKDFEATGKTNKTASSLATHFRKAMYDRIEEANLPVEQQLYIANQLTLPLSRRQQKSIEYKANISITTDSFGVVTSYEKEGCFLVLVYPVKRYDLRKRSKVESDGSPKINDSEKPEVKNSVEDVSRRMPHDREENGSKKIVREDTGSIICEKQSLSVDQETDESKKVSCIKNGFSSNSEKSKANMPCSKDEVSVVNSRSGKEQLVDVMPTNRIECLETDESGIGEHTGTANAAKSVASDNQQFVMKKISNKISNTVTFDRVSSATTVFIKKGKALSFLDNTVDEELKQLLAYIQNKRQLRGVEKMKTEKILELRAKEASELGIGLRNYLRKIQQMIVSEADICSVTMR